ncbi:TPA: hypothetical protein QHR34_002831 [Raoultella ornithinolytica]|nr:hypothetical protein [Raoultella ornithinolytica]HDT1248686.1 hypothetical protein [Raoultella ornithinolytica]
MLTNENQEPLWERKIPLFTAISIFTYSLAYVYQLSFAYYLGYPAYFILVDINSLLKTLSFIGVISFPVLAATIFSFKIYRLSRFWVVFVLIALVAISIYLLVVGFVNPIEFYLSGGKHIIFSITFIAFYPLIMTWQMLLDGHRSFRSLSGAGVLFAIILTFLCTSSIAHINAWGSSGKYKIKEIQGYYILNNVGEKVLVGKCDSDGTYFKLLDAGDELTFVKSGEKERNDFRSCIRNNKPT